MTTIQYTTTILGDDWQTCAIENYEDICKEIDCYERILDDKPVKLYFDIDYKKPFDDETKYSTEIVPEILELVKKQINYLTKSFSDIEPKFCVKSAHSPEYICWDSKNKYWKISLHIIVVNFICLKSIQKEMVENFNELMDDTNWKDYMDMDKIFDNSIYSVNRKIRSPFCSKPNENRRFIIEEGSFTDTIISHYDPGAVICSFKITPKIIDNNILPDLTTTGYKSFIIRQFIDHGLLKNKSIIHGDWTILGTHFKTIFSEKEAVELWGLCSGTDNKMSEYEGHFKYLHAFDNIPKSWNTIRKWARTENIDIFDEIENNYKKQEIKNKFEKLREQTKAKLIAEIDKIDTKIDTKEVIDLNGDIDKAINDLIASETEVSFARLFVKLFGDNFKCTSIKNKLFYHFTADCLWAISEGGTPIRLLLSSEIKDILHNKQIQLTEQIEICEEQIEIDRLQKRIKKIIQLQLKLETTTDKNNILREIQDFILDADFEKSMNKQMNILPIKDKKILNVATCEISDRTIKHKFNYECDAEYRELTLDEDADIRKYFLELFCGHEDTMRCVLDILKSCLTGATIRYIYFITGTGRNGKSLLFNILSAILKSAMDVVSKDIILQKKSNSNITTEFEKLDRCRIGYTTELKEADQLNEQVIKQITGGDPINVRRLHKTDETITPTTNLFVITNELPKFKVEQAILDRLIIIPFNNKFEVNKNKETEMLGKKDQIFSFIMKYGVIRDKFNLTEEMQQAKTDYEEDNSIDHLSDFLENKTIKMDFPENDKMGNHKDKVIERETLIKSYIIWKSELKKYEPAQTNTAFSKRMAKLGYPSDKSNGKTYYKGLKWGEMDEE